MLDNQINTLNTRIQLKFDTYENWQNSTLPILPGEMALALVNLKQNETEQSTLNENNQQIGYKPTVLIKIGDGEKIVDSTTEQLRYKNWNELDYVQTKAGDVYAWAKNANKPTYEAAEIIMTGQDTVADVINDLQEEINNIDISEQIETILNTLNLENTTNGPAITFGTPAVITEITQSNGQVNATKQTLNLGTAAWATVKTNAIADTNDTVGAEDTSLTTAAQVATYVKAKTAALTNAMHFKGALTPEEGATDAETLLTVSNPAAGDIYLIGTKEYVYDGTNWFLLGDEGTYAVRSVVEAALANKVDKVNGKGLSAEDYTTAEKTKLNNVADGAQVNVIEGVTVGGTAVTLTNKVAALGAMAGKDEVAEAVLTTTLSTKINNKIDTVNATIATINDDIITLKAGLAKNNTTVENSVDTDITLAKIAKTGNVDDLIQTQNTYIVFDCGNASGWQGSVSGN